MQKPQPRPHHGAPFIVAKAVLNPYWIRVNPFLDHRSIYIVVVAPALVSSVVGRVDEDAVHPSRIERQESLQGVEIVPMNDHVAIERRLTDSFLGVHDQGPERHRQMVVVNKLLALETQFTHALIISLRHSPTCLISPALSTPMASSQVATPENPTQYQSASCRRRARCGLGWVVTLEVEQLQASHVARVRAGSETRSLRSHYYSKLRHRATCLARFLSSIGPREASQFTPDRACRTSRDGSSGSSRGGHGRRARRSTTGSPL